MQGTHWIDEIKDLTKQKPMWCVKLEIKNWKGYFTSSLLRAKEEDAQF